MIKPAKGWEVNGQFFPTIEEAQKAELRELFGDGPLPAADAPLVVDAIFAHREKLIDILTTTAKSRPSARKSNGGTKTRKPKSVVAQFNEIAQESAESMRAKIEQGKGPQ